MGPSVGCDHFVRLLAPATPVVKATRRSPLREDARARRFPSRAPRRRVRASPSSPASDWSPASPFRSARRTPTRCTRRPTRWPAPRPLRASAADQVTALDQQLAASRDRVDALHQAAGNAAEAANGAQLELEKAAAESGDASAKADAAQATADEATLTLSRYAAEVYQGGGDTSQLDISSAAAVPQEVLDKASGIQAVGAERARMVQDAESARLIAANLRLVASEAEARRATAAAAAKAAADKARQTAQDAVTQTAQIEQQQQQMVAQLAALRNTSVQLEQERQAGIAAEQQRQREEANRGPPRPRVRRPPPRRRPGGGAAGRRRRGRRARRPYRTRAERPSPTRPPRSGPPRSPRRPRPTSAAADARAASTRPATTTMFPDDHDQAAAVHRSPPLISTRLPPGVAVVTPSRGRSWASPTCGAARAVTSGPAQG